MVKILRKAIRIQAHDAAAIRDLYVANGISVDSYPKVPQILREFVERCNEVTGRRDSSDDLMHWMQNQRRSKANGWPTFGGAHKRVAGPPGDLFSPEEKAHLIEVCRPIFEADGLGVDHLAYKPELRDRITREFAALAGRIVDGMTLYVVAMKWRKDGEWFTLEKHRPTDRKQPPGAPNQPPGDPGIGFSDIDEIAS